jgi:hypothetical protein
MKRRKRSKRWREEEIGEKSRVKEKTKPGVEKALQCKE